jgi:hypothetical protein
MERWFPSSDGEAGGSLTALRDDGQGHLPRNSKAPVCILTASGMQQQGDVSTRGRLANAEADAGSHDSRRTGKNCLAIPPYGKLNYVKQRGDLEEAGGFPRLLAVALYAPK